MKTLLATCVVAIATLVFLPATASADNCRPAGHCSQCGGTIYAYPVLVGYDSCRRPIYQWVKRPHYHPVPRQQYYRSQPNVSLSFSFGSPYRSYRPSYGFSRYGYGYGRNDCRSRSGGSVYLRIR